MPQDKLSMRKIRDVLRYRHSTGLSLEAIARALNISKGVVAKYLRLAADAGLGWPLPEDLDDTALEKRLYQQASARAPKRRSGKGSVPYRIRPAAPRASSGPGNRATAIVSRSPHRRHSRR